MKREILFRGKRVDNGEWVEGDLIQLDSRIMIADKGMTAYDKGNAHEEISLECVEVAPETVGQFTGLTDKNGVEIYEGDIISTEKIKIMQVGWDSRFSSFSLTQKDWAFSHFFGESCDPEQCLVVGNIFDNPELF